MASKKQGYSKLNLEPSVYIEMNVLKEFPLHGCLSSSWLKKVYGSAYDKCRGILRDSCFTPTSVFN